MYEQIAILSVSILEIFEEINVNNFGRAVAFLTYVYVLKNTEDVTHHACAVSGQTHVWNTNCKIY